MNDSLIKKTTAFFEESFGLAPKKIVLSPGRINIIGEHIDYNDGYVLPAAIDKIICFAFEKSNSNKSRIIAIDLDDEFEVRHAPKILIQHFQCPLQVLVFEHFSAVNFPSNVALSA